MQLARQLGLLALIAVGMAAHARAQGWAKTVGGAQGDAARAVARTADGGFIVAGTTASFGSPAQHLWVLRLDATGAIAWQKSYPGLDVPCCVVVSPDGGYLVASGSESRSTPWLVKLDAGGAIEWQRAYELGLFSRFHDLSMLADGSLVVGATDYDGYVRSEVIVRTDVSGVPTAADLYWVPGGVTSVSVRAGADGGLAVAAATRSGAWLMKLDARRNVVSSKTLTLPTVPHKLTPLRAAADGGWLLGGWMESRYWSLSSSFVIKLDAALGVTWASRVLGETVANVEARDVQELPDGGLLLGGFASDDVPSRYPPRFAGAFVVQFDRSGQAQWHREYGPLGYAASALVALPDGGALAVGETAAVAGYVGASKPGDAFLLRIDGQGGTGGCGEGEPAPFVAAPMVVASAATEVTREPVSVSVKALDARAVDSAAAPIDVGDHHEPDDSCAALALMNEGAPAHFDFCDDPVDWFVLDACDGATYTITTSRLGPLTDTVVDLLNPDCTTVIASDDDGADGGASLLRWLAPADGRFPVRIRQRDGTAGPERGYDVTLTRTGPGCQTWARTYGIDVAGAVLTARPDGSLVVGTTLLRWVERDGFPLDFEDAAILTLDAAGEVIRGERLVGAELAGVSAIDLSPDGGTVIAGRAVRDGKAFAFVIKRDASGAIEWQRRVDSPDLNVLRIRQHGSGFVMVGAIWRQGNPRDYWLGRIDASGAPSWSLTLGDEVSATDVLVTTAGDIIVVGGGLGGTTVQRFDAAGTLLSQQVYDTAEQWAHPRIAAAADGAMLVASGASIMRIESDGSVAWRHVFAWYLRELPLLAGAIEPRRGAGCIVAGAAADGDGFIAAALLSLDAAGNLEWSRVVTTPSGRTGGIGSIVTMPDLGFVIGTATDVAPIVPVRSRPIVMRLDRDGLTRQPCLAEDAGITMSCVGTPWSETSATPVPVPLTVSDASFTSVPFTPAYEQACAGSAPRRPWEVSPPGSPEPLVFVDHSTLRWEQASASNSDTFNLYRSDTTRLRAGDLGTCFRSFIATNAASDPAVPPAGTAWTYLVTGRNGLGEGTMGRASFGMERANRSPCP